MWPMLVSVIPNAAPHADQHTWVSHSQMSARSAVLDSAAEARSEPQEASACTLLPWPKSLRTSGHSVFWHRCSSKGGSALIHQQPPYEAYLWVLLAMQNTGRSAVNSDVAATVKWD